MHRTITDNLECARSAAALQSYFLQTVTQRLGTRAAETLRGDADRIRDEMLSLVENSAGQSPQQIAEAWQSYLVDAAQRGVLTLDVLRRWSDQNTSLQDDGAPTEHVLIYDHDVVMDGRGLPSPCNYVLLRIHPDADQEIHEWKRPYVIIDPRAGHGPGIGGFKRDSQIGVALADGHPVYFVSFRQDPEPGQTLASVAHAEAAFLRHIRQLHPDSPPPIVVGNCQGGWATAILAATHPDLAGPIVLNGSPMSYWSGKLGQDPMRYSGGLGGGAVPAALAGDLGGGIFDGAYLVQNFEELNPGRNWFRKYYDLYRDVDNGAERFLEFEKWWGAFYLMTTEEIRWIVENLFIGNRLGRNTAQLETGRPIDLKQIRAPIICFASHGDNITPVGQALNWILDTYSDEHEIEILGQRVLYLVHEDVGHLGIFVSSKIARKEHSQMASTLKTIEALAPGLYELVIEDVVGEGKEKTFAVSFARRTMEDVASHSGSRRDEPAFAAVARASEAMVEAYDTVIGPFIQPLVTPEMGKLVRDTNPMRTTRRSFASSNPAMTGVPAAAEHARQTRKPAAAENPFVLAEKLAADMIETSWNIWRDLREASQETAFFAIWGSPLAIAYGQQRALGRTHKRPEDLVALPTVQDALARIEDGGFAEALVRILVLLANTRPDVRHDRLERAANVLNESEPFSSMPEELRSKKIQEQTLIVEYGGDAALESLPGLLRTDAERRRALDTARFIVGEVKEMTAATRSMMERIEGLLAPLQAPNAAQ
ncbi:alpha/beta fold hydrolase [Tropicimonas sediminicola]|uniref:Poly(3-hydroxyalkanoate) synthetase n=1 Tax=Tropicimonas sediminicola TaxID=1031541 RepID=A0A239LN25_9RHOB|nr:alpha/beta fold hydrolase [Tropicimonas sediminicola]SNT31690.1 Protein of unknown function [Tropicimonas sediminicola]